MCNTTKPLGRTSNQNGLPKQSSKSIASYKNINEHTQRRDIGCCDKQIMDIVNCRENQVRNAYIGFTEQKERARNYSCDPATKQTQSNGFDNNINTSHLNHHDNEYFDEYCDESDNKYDNNDHSEIEDVEVKANEPDDHLLNLSTFESVDGILNICSGQCGNRFSSFILAAITNPVE